MLTSFSCGNRWDFVEVSSVANGFNRLSTSEMRGVKQRGD